ncbi:glycosyltransferase family 2 protein [uncultured Oscillibacter sp.]|uniref:glycosyltransferase family 2 protein n=1 Tax=uncultured Oscillibacter sp. TaxID=876091 RepID=UPI0025D4FDED|nr:glycosyltransferase family 2 protein [uncultured Oscillibacter sp.]
MDMHDLISVIIPVYDVEKYLPACLRSVLAQTYGDLEIILVDDGSPDGCPALCDEWAGKDPRITVYHKPNGGLSDARNHGTARASGAYVTFVDSDDCIAPDHIESLYRPILERHVDISCGSYVEFEDDPCRFPGNDPETIGVVSGRQACDQMMRSGDIALNVVWAKLIRADLVRRYPFPVGRTHEDEATACKYYYSSETVAIGHRRSYGYRQQIHSITHRRHDKLNEDAAWCMFHRAEWLYEQGDMDLARTAWKRVLYFILSDSVEHDGRSDAQLWEALRYCERKVALRKKDKLNLLAYRYFPGFSAWYLRKKYDRGERPGPAGR